MTRRSQPGAAAGIARSLRIYHRDPARRARMDALNAAFVRPGALAFDIGAHVGDRVASFRRLGARVVAVEPQPAAMRALRLLFRRDPMVTLEPSAMAASPGEAVLHLNTRNPTVSSLSQAFVRAADSAPLWDGQRWDASITVPTRTLDDLIARHGPPNFLKIDVEGFEAEVLAGLSTPPRTLSFEFTTIDRAVAVAALDRLGVLGRYEFNVSIGEAHSLCWPSWRSREDLYAWLSGVDDAVNSGDIYARRV